MTQIDSPECKEEYLNIFTHGKRLTQSARAYPLSFSSTRASRDMQEHAGNRPVIYCDQPVIDSVILLQASVALEVSISHFHDS
jgi:hypothetical protein